jgi:NTE family protein
MKDFADRPFTLALSSGFFGFYAHVGFLKALDELKLKPAAYAGTSAGAIVGAAAAIGLSVKEIEKLILNVSRKEFWDPSPGFGFLRGRKLQELIEKEIGSDFNQLKVPLRVPVFDIARRSTIVLTSGNLARAVRASSAVPFMFHPVRIEKRFYWDGGIQDKMGIHGIPKDEKILSHYLQSSSGDPHSIYESKRDEKTLQARGENLMRIQLKNLPRSHPFAMNRGPEIIQAAYKKALVALQE